MQHRPLLYYITDRRGFAGTESARRASLLSKISDAAKAGVDYIQLREKDLPARELEKLSRDAVRLIREANSTTALLINSRTDVALAAGADGVHLRSQDVTPQEVREIWAKSLKPDAKTPLIGVSCHSLADVTRAVANAASFAVFAPIFEKKDAPQSRPPAGLEKLREACREKIPVLALGGVTLDNARMCLQAGAAGVAGIRLFQDTDVAELVRRLREH